MTGDRVHLREEGHRSVAALGAGDIAAYLANIDPLRRLRAGAADASAGQPAAVQPAVQPAEGQPAAQPAAQPARKPANPEPATVGAGLQAALQAALQPALEAGLEAVQPALDAVAGPALEAVQPPAQPRAESFLHQGSAEAGSRSAHRMTNRHRIAQTWDLLRSQTNSSAHLKPFSGYLLRTLQAASGVYVDGRGFPDDDLKNTVLFTMSNQRTSDLLRNFLCSASRFGLKVVVFALDRDLAEHHADIDAPVLWEGSESAEQSKLIDVAGANFGDRRYNFVVFHKVQIAGRLLASGFNAIFVDADVVLMQDPLPAIFPNSVDFRAVPLRGNRTGWNDPAEMRRANTKLSQFSTGQFFLRAAPPGLRFVDAWVRAMMKSPLFLRRRLNDQDVLNLIWDRGHGPESSPSPKYAIDTPKISYAAAWTPEGCARATPTSETVLTICPLSTTKFGLNCWTLDKGKSCRLQSAREDGRPACRMKNNISTDDFALFHFDCQNIVKEGVNPKRKRAEALGLWMEPQCTRYGIPVMASASPRAGFETAETFAQVLALSQMGN